MAPLGTSRPRATHDAHPMKRRAISGATSARAFEGCSLRTRPVDRWHHARRWDRRPPLRIPLVKVRRGTSLTRVALGPCSSGLIAGAPGAAVPARTKPEPQAAALKAIARLETSGKID